MYIIRIISVFQFILLFKGRRKTFCRYRTSIWHPETLVWHVKGVRNMVSTYSIFVLPPVLQLENKTPFLSSSGCLLLSYNLCIQLQGYYCYRVLNLLWLSGEVKLQLLQPTLFIHTVEVWAREHWDGISHIFERRDTGVFTLQLNLSGVMIEREHLAILCLWISALKKIHLSFFTCHSLTQSFFTLEVFVLC